MLCHLNWSVVSSTDYKDDDDGDDEVSDDDDVFL